MFSKEDFCLKNTESPLEFVIIIAFVMVIAPFLGVAYTIGFVLDMLDLLDD